MSTHNSVLKLGEQLYLEGIAINPHAPQPNRPRWFQRDEPEPLHPVRLATWVARTNGIIVHAQLSTARGPCVDPFAQS